MNKKKIVLVTNDEKACDLLKWVQYNQEVLEHHELYATGTAGRLIEKELGVRVHKLKSETVVDAR